MEVTLKQVKQCPSDTELIVFCRLIGAEGCIVTLEDLGSDEAHSFEVTDADIPEEMFLPVEVNMKRNDSQFEVTGIHVVENKEMIAILTDSSKLKLFEQQSSRAIKIHNSRLV